MKPARVVSLLITSSMCMILWTETSGHHLCSLCEKTRSGEACRGKMRQLTPDLVRYLGTSPDSWACSMHWKRAKREANRFCACPLPVHCKELNTHNIPERLVPVFDRIGGSIPGYRSKFVVYLWNENETWNLLVALSVFLLEKCEI